MTQVKLTTNHGDIVIELNAEKAPITVANFIEYVKAGHYENTIFHRVIGNFMVQEAVISYVDEELGGSRMRLHGARHGNGVLVVRQAVVSLVLDAWALVFFLFHARLETAALHHEVTDHAVENGVFVVAGVHVLDEVGNGDRCFLGVQLDDDVTVVGGQFDLSHGRFSFKEFVGVGAGAPYRFGDTFWQSSGQGAQFSVTCRNFEVVFYRPCN